MKHKISMLALGDGIIRYTIQTKNHWWNKWRFIMDGNQPMLFREEDLKKMGFVIMKEDKK